MAGVSLHVRSASNVSITPDIPEYEHPDPPLADVYEREEEKGVTLTRPLGDSEISYYLPSKEDGGSDMYVRLTLLLHPSNFTPTRLQIAFAILQIRHPLLGARVISNYDTFDATSELEARFEFDAPASNVDAVKNAERYVSILDGPEHTLEGLITSYVDGPRTLSDDLLCKLVLIRPSPPPPSFTPLEFACLDDLDQVEEKIKIEMCLFSTHFIGDAGSIQFIVKELMYILTFPTSHLLNVVLAEDIKGMHASIAAMGEGSGGLLPQSMEARLPPIRGKFKSTLSRLEFMRFQGRMIGGQTLPRNAPPIGTGGKGGSPPRSPTGSGRPSTPLAGAVPGGTDLHKFLSTYTRQTNTKTHELIISSSRTARLLAKCKKEGVTVNAALFALVGYAWVESQQSLGEKGKLPSLLYSARNMRPFLPPKPPKFSGGKGGGGWKGWQSYYYLSLSYFNVVLPCWIPGEGRKAIRGEEEKEGVVNGHGITSSDEAPKVEPIANGHGVTATDEDSLTLTKVEALANGHVSTASDEEGDFGKVQTLANGHVTTSEEEHAEAPVGIAKVEALTNGHIDTARDEDSVSITKVESFANGHVIPPADDENVDVPTTAANVHEEQVKLEDVHAVTKVETLANGHADHTSPNDEEVADERKEKTTLNGHVDLTAAESEGTIPPWKLRTDADSTADMDSANEEKETEKIEDASANDESVTREIVGNGHAITSETNEEVHQEEVKVVENGHAHVLPANGPTSTQEYDGSILTTTVSSTRTVTPIHFPPPSPPSLLSSKVFWHRARSARAQSAPPKMESMMSLILFVSRTLQMSKIRKEGSVKFAVARKEGEKRVREVLWRMGSNGVGDVGKMLSGLGVRLPPSLSLRLPGTPSTPGTPGTPTFRTPPATPRLEGPPPPSPSSLKPQNTALHPSHSSPHIPPPAPAQALLGLSCLGSFDPLFPPPAQLGHFPTDHVSVLPFEPISLGAGCRLKHGGSLLYAYTFDGCLTVVLGYDAGVLGLREEDVEGLWGKLIEGIGRWMGD